MKKILLCMALPLFLTGCYTTGTQYPATFTDRIMVEDDPYIEFVQYKSDVVVKGPMGDKETMVLRAVQARDDKSDVDYFLQWTSLYVDSDWRRYSMATTQDAEKLKTDVIDRKVASCPAGSCIYNETLNIFFPESLLKENKDTGFNVKIFAQKHSGKVVLIPASIINALLLKTGAI